MKKSYFIVFILLCLSACSVFRPKQKDFYCITPAGQQHFTSPQAESVKRDGRSVVVITNPGTGEEIELGADLCVIVTQG